MLKVSRCVEIAQVCLFALLPCVTDKEKEIEAAYGKGTDKAKAERERALHTLTAECEDKIRALRQSLDDCVANLVQVRLACMRVCVCFRRLL
jgi:hypothetical protein